MILRKTYTSSLETLVSLDADVGILIFAQVLSGTFTLQREMKIGIDLAFPPLILQMGQKL